MISADISTSETLNLVLIIMTTIELSYGQEEYQESRLTISGGLAWLALEGGRVGGGGAMRIVGFRLSITRCRKG